MRHLTADELVDVVEGLVAESDLPHLAACDACRHRLAELKATMAMAAEAEVPEPSPLFWDHFSARVHEAVAIEGVPRESWWRRVVTVVSGPGVLMPLSAVAAAVFVVAVVFNTRMIAPEVHPPAQVAQSTPTAPPSAMSGTLSVDLLNDSMDVNDPSLSLVADLTAALGADAAVEAGLVPKGSAEHALTHMNGGELRELQRLLKEELGRKGA